MCSAASSDPPADENRPAPKRLLACNEKLPLPGGDGDDNEDDGGGGGGGDDDDDDGIL